MTETEASTEPEPEQEKAVVERERFRLLVGSPVGDLTIAEIAFLVRWSDEHEDEAFEICPELRFVAEL